MGTGLEVLLLFPSAKRIELTHFVISPLPFLFKPFHHRVPLSSEVSQMSGSSLCFLCLFDGFIVRKIIVEPSFTAGGVGGTGPLVLFHPLCVSVFCLFSKKKKTKLMWNRKESFIHSGARIQGAVSALALVLTHCSRKSVIKGFVGSSKNSFCLAQQIGGRLVAAACSAPEPRTTNLLVRAHSSA